MLMEITYTNTAVHLIFSMTLHNIEVRNFIRWMKVFYYFILFSHNISNSNICRWNYAFKFFIVHLLSHLINIRNSATALVSRNHLFINILGYWRTGNGSIINWIFALKYSSIKKTYYFFIIVIDRTFGIVALRIHSVCKNLLPKDQRNLPFWLE